MWRWWHTIGLLLLIAAISLAALFSSAVLALFYEQPQTSMKALWFILMALMGITIVWIGYGITGVVHGFLIDPRNKMSLSRLQLVLWTIMILPAFLAAAVFNFGAGADDPVNITVPAEVWGLLGISAGSLVGSGIIKSGRPEANPEQVAQAQEALRAEVEQAADPVAALQAQRALAPLNNVQVVNAEPEQASASDLFKGELVGSVDHLEVGKVQMFFFTLLVVYAYGKDIAAGFDNASEKISSLPELSAGILALLAISHAGYLGNKSVPIERETPPGP
jgi:hypothetical protein